MESEKIFAVHSMLHLIYHRNKNQHGTSKWWKWLSTLKRVTLNLARSLENDPSSQSKSVSPVNMYRKYLATNVIPRSYLAFSNVVADGQFSTLGTVLLATLARLTRATGIDRDLKTKAQPQVEKTASEPSSRAKAPQEDVGELVCRWKDDAVHVSNSKANGSTEARIQEDGKKKPKNTAGVEQKAPKKKKKKKNAIDDLFAGLV